MKIKHIRNIVWMIALASVVGCSGSGSCPPGSTVEWVVTI